MKHRLELIVMLALLLCTAPVHARDWFVRAGSAGDGTIEKPFRDPYRALEEAGPGDTIHVAQGIYHGELDAANWVIATPNLTWLGGYNADFSQRDPWHFPSELRFSKEFRGKNSGTLIEGWGSHENFVLDGFVLDQKEGNEYGEEPYASLSRPRSDPLIRLSAPGIQIRNCLILNGGHGGVEAGGGRIENNLILNISRDALINFGSHQGTPTLIRGNTFLFAWSDIVRSGGTRAGRCVNWNSDQEFEIVDNIFLGCDNVAVDGQTAEKLTLKGNVFWLNGWLDVSVEAKDQTVKVDHSSLSDLDDAGLKASAGNVAVDPELTGLDPKWMEHYLDRVARDYPDAKLEELNALRRSLGLPAITEKKAQSRIHEAMAYDRVAALKIVPAKLKQGAHPAALEVKAFSAPPQAVTYEYEPTKWQQLAESPQSIDGQRVEIAGALGRESSTFGFAGITAGEYREFQFQDVEERLGQRPLIYFTKGTKAERMLKDIRQWDGNGTPEETHLVRGLVEYDTAAKMSRKGIIIVDSITAITESAPLESEPRPSGRDWFVRAGSTGKGSKEEPFKDPWQALEAARPGDTIHVAEGEYLGKLRSGTWKIKTPYLGLLGGYDKEFKERDPWKHPSRLGYSPGSSGGGSEPYIVGADDHTGFIFDGFVLDGRDVNRLDASGDLASRFPEDALMTLGSPDVIVRNSLFVNGGGSALEAWGDNMRIENNIILNSNYRAIDIRGASEHPFIIRNNTILFTWHADRDRGSRSAGTAIFAHAETRFELDGNIIGYADGQAVSIGPARKRLRIVNNVFTRNRFANVTDLDKIVVDDKNMGLMQELGFGSAAGNAVLDPRMSFDGTWWADYNRESGPAFFARPYDWKAALNLLPQNPACTAGARPTKLEVHFNQ